MREGQSFVPLPHTGLTHAARNSRNGGGGSTTDGSIGTGATPATLRAVSGAVVAGSETGAGSVTGSDDGTERIAGDTHARPSAIAARSVDGERRMMLKLRVGERTTPDLEIRCGKSQ